MDDEVHEHVDQDIGKCGLFGVEPGDGKEGPEVVGYTVADSEGEEGGVVVLLAEDEVGEGEGVGVIDEFAAGFEGAEAGNEGYGACEDEDVDEDRVEMGWSLAGGNERGG